ncbi:MAG: aminomethyl transferase family protein [Chloroflexi bacterium]|nr:aminomethyl transferase family protein [Chloroflexota bacterium]
MIETQTNLRHSPLWRVTNREGADLPTMVHAGWELGSQYRGPLDEYQAARQGLAILDQSAWACLTLSNTDRLGFVQRMSTNDATKLSPGGGMKTIFTTPTGRILDETLILCQPDQLLVVGSLGMGAALFNWFRHYIFFRDKVKAQNITDTTARLALFGPSTPAALAAVLDVDVSSWSLYQHADIPISESAALAAGSTITLARIAGFGEPAASVIGTAESLTWLWGRLVEHGGQPLGMRAYDMLRIEAGIPEQGRELGEEYNPHEAGIIDAVSFSKGCYIGQEVIARLDTYQKIQKHLMGIQPVTTGAGWAESLQPGAKLISSTNQEAGFITSAAYSPALAGPIALGYIRTKWAEPGAELRLQAQGDNQLPVQLVKLPFVGEALRVAGDDVTLP